MKEGISGEGESSIAAIRGRLEGFGRELQSMTAKTSASSRMRSRVNTWNDDVKALATHINAQLDYSKSLRTSDTLARLLEDNPRVKLERGVKLLGNTLIADIRRLQSVLGEHGLKPSGKGAGSETEFQGDQLGLDIQVPPPSEWVRRTHSLEAELQKIQLEDFGKNRGDQSAAILRLTQLREQLLVELSDILLKRKHDLEITLGMTSSGKGVPSLQTVKISQQLAKFLSVAEAFASLEDLVRRSRLLEDGMTYVDAVGKLERRTRALESELGVTKKQLTTAEATIALLRSGDDKQTVSQQALRLDEALMRTRKVEAELSRVREASVELETEKGRLMSENESLRETLDRTRAVLEKRTSWFEPRIKQLEAESKHAAAALSEVRLNVELLSSMYKSNSEELERMTAKMRAIEADRNAMSERLAGEVRSKVDANREQQRLDTMLLRMSAARESAVQEYRKVKADIDVVKAELKETKDLLAQRTESLKEKEALTAGFMREKSEMARELKELRECVQELQEKQENAAAFMNNHEEAIAKIERKWEGKVNDLQKAVEKAEKGKSEANASRESMEKLMNRWRRKYEDLREQQGR